MVASTTHRARRPDTLQISKKLHLSQKQLTFDSLTYLSNLFQTIQTQVLMWRDRTYTKSLCSCKRCVK